MKRTNYKKFLKGLLLVLCLLALLAGPVLVYAQTTKTVAGTEDVPASCKNFYDRFTAKTDKPGEFQDFNITDGLPKICTATQLLTAAMNLLLGFSAGVAVVFIMIGGFWYLTAAGNEEQAEKGQKALTMAIIGLAVIIMSFVIVRVSLNVLTLGQKSASAPGSTPGAGAETASPAGVGNTTPPTGQGTENPETTDAGSIFYRVTNKDVKDFEDVNRDYLTAGLTYTIHPLGKGASFLVVIDPSDKMSRVQLRSMCNTSEPVVEAYINDILVKTSAFTRASVNVKWGAQVRTEAKLNDNDVLSVKICGKVLNKTQAYQPTTIRE